MAQKTHDIVVKVGEYTDRNGQQKARWKNVGAFMRADDGGVFAMLDRSFNPAGVPNPDNREGVLLSFFVPQDRRDGEAQAGGQNTSGQSAMPDDSIPF